MESLYWSTVPAADQPLLEGAVPDEEPLLEGTVPGVRLLLMKSLFPEGAVPSESEGTVPAPDERKGAAPDPKQLPGQGPPAKKQKLSKTKSSGHNKVDDDTSLHELLSLEEPDWHASSSSSSTQRPAPKVSSEAPELKEARPKD